MLQGGAALRRSSTELIFIVKCLVQWDPERCMDGTATQQRQALTCDLPGMRSIQIGLRGSAVEMLLDPNFVLKISDVTEDFQAFTQHVKMPRTGFKEDSQWHAEVP